MDLRRDLGLIVGLTPAALSDCAASPVLLCGVSGTLVGGVRACVACILFPRPQLVESRDRRTWLSQCHTSETREHWADMGLNVGEEALLMQLELSLEKGCRK